MQGETPAIVFDDRAEAFARLSDGQGDVFRPGVLHDVEEELPYGLVGQEAGGAVDAVLLDAAGEGDLEAVLPPGLLSVSIAPSPLAVIRAAGRAGS